MKELGRKTEAQVTNTKDRAAKQDQEPVLNISRARTLQCVVVKARLIVTEVSYNHPARAWTRY